MSRLAYVTVYVAAVAQTWLHKIISINKNFMEKK